MVRRKLEYLTEGNLKFWIQKKKNQTKNHWVISGVKVKRHVTIKERTEINHLALAVECYGCVMFFHQPRAKPQAASLLHQQDKGGNRRARIENS